MKIKMLTGMSGPTVSVAPGDEIDVSDDEGQRLVKAKYAIVVKQTRQTATKKRVSETRDAK